MAAVATLTVDLFANTARFVSEMGKAQKSAKDFGREALTLKSLTRELGVGIGVGAFVAFTKSAGDAAEKTVQLADRLRISTGELQAVQYAAEQSGVPFEALSGAISKLYKNLDGIASGASDAAEPLRRLGIDAATFVNLGLEQQLEALAKGFENVNDPAAATAIAVGLFGKSGAELIPFFEQGAAGIQELTDKFRDLGLELDRGTLEKLDASADSLDDLGRIIKTQASVAVAEFSELLSGLVETLAAAAQLIGPVVTFAFKTFSGVVQAGGAVLSYFASVLAGILSKLPIVGKAFDDAADFLNELSNRYAQAAESSLSYAIGLGKVADAQERVAKTRPDGSSANPFDLGEVVSSSNNKASKAQERARLEAIDALAFDVSKISGRRIEESQLDSLYAGFLAATRTAAEKAGDEFGSLVAQLDELFKRGVIDATEYNRRIAEITDRYLSDVVVDQRKIAEEVSSGWVEEAGRISDAFADRFLELRGSAKDLLRDLVRIFLQSQLRNAITSLFGSGGAFGAGGIVGAIGTLFGGGRATGGPVSAGKIYRVNENTPRSEYFAPSVDGMILRADQVQGSGGGRNVTIVQNIDARGSDSGVLTRLPGILENERNRTKAEIIREIRGGVYRG